MTFRSIVYWGLFASLGACASSPNAANPHLERRYPALWGPPEPLQPWTFQEQFGHSGVFLANDAPPWPSEGVEALSQRLLPLKGTPCSETKVKFLVVVEETGAVAGVHWTEPISDPCTQVATDTIRQMKFLPGEVTGKSVKSVTVIEAAYD